MRILAVSGWRGWTDAPFIERWLEWARLEGFVLIRFGDATGVDEITFQWAARMRTETGDLLLSRYMADWSRFNRGAGPIRNRQMLLGLKPDDPKQSRADLLLAFPQPGVLPGFGSGTWSCIGEACCQGIEVKIPPYGSVRQ